MTENKTFGQKLGSFVDSLVSGTAKAETTNTSGPGCTLRYATENVIVDLTNAVGKTIRCFFEENAEALGLPSTGSLGVRSEGQPVDADSEPEAGRTYTASVARETKGS